MKVIFLDVDGVLNGDYTKETFFEEETQGNFIGVDKKMSTLFLEWKARRDYEVILSSTWRSWYAAKELLKENGISWLTVTPRDKNRGLEIQRVLDEGYVKQYVILDDLHPGEFLKHQRQYLVQTSPKHGLRKKNLIKIDKLMGWVDGNLSGQDRNI